MHSPLPPAPARRIMNFAMPKAVTTIDRCTQILLGVAVALVPFFFVPLTQDFYTWNKWALLVLVALGFVVLALVRIVVTGHITLSRSHFTIGLLALTGTTLISLIVSSPNKIEGLLSPLGPITWAALAIIAIVSPAALTARARRLLLGAFLVATSAAGAIAVYQFFGIGGVFAGTAQFLADPSWTPVGSPLALAALLVLAAPLALEQIVVAVKKQETALATMAMMSLAALSGGLVCTLIRLVPQLPTLVLPPTWAWSILLEVYKTPRVLLTGVGAENFLAAFTAARPPVANTTNLWNTRFLLSSNLLFHLATTNGLISVAALLWYLRSFWPSGFTRSWRLQGAQISLLLALVSLLVTPPHLSLVIAATLLVVLSQDGTHHTMTIRLPQDILIRSIIAVTGILAVFPLLYLLGLAYAAELSLYAAAGARQERDGKKTYNLQIQAVTANPYVSRYHMALAQTSLEIADVLAGELRAASASGGSLATNPRETQQEVATLVQQAIREGKNAVVLAPQQVIAWEHLAKIYQVIAPFTTNTTPYVIANYQQARTLDPTNALLRLSLGGAFMQARDYDSAIAQFLAAASLRPDLAGAYYNLGYAYYAKSEYFPAAIALTRAINLASDPNTDDVARAKQQLADVKKRLTPEQIAQLDHPQPTSTPSLPASVLDQQAHPPAPTVTVPSPGQ